MLWCSNNRTRRPFSSVQALELGNLWFHLMTFITKKGTPRRVHGKEGDSTKAPIIRPHLGYETILEKYQLSRTRLTPAIGMFYLDLASGCSFCKTNHFVTFS